MEKGKNYFKEKAKELLAELDKAGSDPVKINNWNMQASTLIMFHAISETVSPKAFKKEQQ